MTATRDDPSVKKLLQNRDRPHMTMPISVAEALEAPTESIVLANSAVQQDLRQMRTELWKGDIHAVSRATRAVRPNLRSFRDEPHAPARKKRVRKLKAVMKKLDKYVCNPDAWIIALERPRASRLARLWSRALLNS